MSNVNYAIRLGSLHAKGSDDENEYLQSTVADLTDLTASMR